MSTQRSQTSLNRDTFFSNRNYYLIFNLLRNDMKSKFQYDIQHNEYCKGELFAQMNQIFDNNETKTLRELNKLTIKKVGPSFFQRFQQERETPSQRERPPRPPHALRDVDISQRSLPQFVDMRPEELSTKEDGEKITQAYQQLSQERDLTTTSKPSPPQFELAQEDDTDIIQRYKSIAKDRENFLQELETQTNPSSTSTNSDKVNVSTGSEPLLGGGISTKTLGDLEQVQEEHVINSFDRHNEMRENFENQQEEQKQQQEKILDDQERKKVTEEQVFQDHTTKGGSTSEVTSDSSVLDSNWEHTHLPSPLVESRQQQDEEFRNRHQFLPSTFHQQQQEHQQQLQTQLEKTELERSQNDSLAAPLLSPTGRKTEKITQLEINSLDRSWNQSSKIYNRYHFVVTFSPDVDSWVRRPLFANNPTIPATETEAKDGERGQSNRDGWSWQGVEYSAYNASQPFGDLVGYEDIKESTPYQTGISQRFRNITELRLVMITVPAELVVNPKSQQNVNVILSYPFLLLHIEEIDGVYEATNDLVNQSFCKVVYSNDWTPNAYIGSGGYVSLRPASMESKIFNTPLASLQKLTLRLLTPLGELVSDFKDHADIRSIVYDFPEGAEESGYHYLLVSLHQYVHKSIFAENSRVQIRGYEVPLEHTIAPLFESFLNRSEGHLLIALSTPTSRGYINSFYLQSECQFNEITGNWKTRYYTSMTPEEEPDTPPLIFTSFVQELQDTAVQDYRLGKVVSCSHQTHFAFQISTIEEDRSVLNTQIV